MDLFGLSKLNAERRRKEISIRKVLGQTAAQVTLMFFSEFSKLVVLSVFIALPISYLMINELLSNFAYKIPLSFWYSLRVGSAALAIAMLTVSTQAIKVANSNIVTALIQD